MVFAQSDPGVTDNRVLDQFRIPFGDWMDQAVDWIATELTWLLDAIEWPFQFLLNLLVRDFLEDISWVWVVLIMFVIASLSRNIRVGAFTAVALTICGLLGNAYWIETARTIGFIAVAVILCVIIGIPVGIACGRIDGIWQVVRPVLDAMQVVHSFVYMLPFIYFWGIGTTSATMVTMIFAIPPLIRLTNLGIRQVPEDVVEASRAYGAPEWRVLTDVQLPLARPAIMTGVNQTLLLAISMLGIAAIMGAGGLGRLLFQALSNQSVQLGTSAGLAFFLVAVVLDRISQREDADSGNLFHRIHMAWAHRRDPEALIPEAEEIDDEGHVDTSHFAAVTSAERMPMGLVGVGGLLAVIGVFLPWASDAGAVSAYGRRADESLVGESFSGLSASGGSWFGYVVLAGGLFILASIVKVWFWPGEGPRWLTTDGAAIAAIAVLLVSLGHILIPTAPNAVDPGVGIGNILALVGGAIATVGAVLWLRVAPHTPLHPLPAGIAVGRMVGIGIAIIVLVVAMFSGWSFDARSDVIIDDETQAEIDRLTEQAREDPENAAVYAAQLSALSASLQAEERIVTDGMNGSRLGVWTLLAGGIAAAVGLISAGVFGTEERKRWLGSVLTAGVGAGIMGLTLGWIATLIRAADPNYVSGIGSFLAMCAGFFILGSVVSVLREFRRARIYADSPSPLDELDLTQAVVEEELVVPSGG